MRTQNNNNQTALRAGKRELPGRDSHLHLIGWESGASFLDNNSVTFNTFDTKVLQSAIMELKFLKHYIN